MAKEGKGKFDDDEFLILPDGSFYDGEGIYFNKWGFDYEGGHYDENTGEYIARPPRNGLPRLRREEIEIQDGDYDADGFYHLTSGGFYDPYGFYFDEHNMDEDGGQYDEKGIYRTAEELDKIRDQEYDEEDYDEEESKDTDAQLEREANFDTHVKPVIIYV